MIEKVITNENEWSDIVNKFQNNDVYFEYSYYKSFSILGNDKPQLFYFCSDQGKVAYPYMLRKIDLRTSSSQYFDISTVYGYGGPLFELSTTGNLSLLQEEFEKVFKENCINSNIIAQFDRFHPLLKNHEFFSRYEEVTLNRETITIDLTDQNQIWGNIHPKRKNLIRKSLKNDIHCVIDDRKETLNDFIEIYYETMKINEADDYYFFKNEFFEVSQELLGKKLVICNAYKDDEIICSILVLVSDNYLHYYLSGTRAMYKSLQPNSLLLYEIAKWGNNIGKKFFHLGGGVSSEKDSLYRFKKSFNRKETAENNFYIGKRIHNLEVYTHLCDVLDKDKNSNFFPAYRG
ncbi:GNAT family N-acetyltransferase [Enterococcus gallinarum]|uniref:GNAT family N-acetyltransferase n=1 Tax=Enterococcus gallinarum TaxID=1353 RepID=UPI00288ECB82|nr:GNAT family N-acetyltransferase [Enterococcus gallinarum]MDT2719651.1 GNAT family N-acetyltransferase [Enterococcus gallinarum]